MKSELTARWADPVFVTAKKPIIDAVFHSPQFKGPADLRGLCIGVDAQPAELCIKNHFGNTEISDVSLDFSELCTSFYRGNFVNISLRNARVIDSVFIKASFQNCDFSESRLTAIMDDAVFTGCSFRKTEFWAKSLFDSQIGRRVKFKNCDFTEARFKTIVSRGGRFDGCTFAEAIFSQCDFQGTQFTGEQPRPDQFEGGKLPKFS